MTATRGPISSRRRLRLALRRARDDNGLTQDQVAQTMDWSLSKLIRIENGSVGISTNDLRALLELYRVTDPETVHGLLDLARIGRAKPWWAEYRGYTPSPDLQTLIGLESSASVIHIFSQNVFSGLLQTEEYARTALRTFDPSVPESELQARVAIRLRRQREVFDGDDPPIISVILDEAVICRIAGDPGVMRTQLDHVLKLMTRPNVSIRIMPFAAGIYPMISSFFVLSFPDRVDPDVTYVDSHFSEDLIEDGTRVARYREAFATLQESALSHADSSTLIQQVAHQLG